MIHQFIDASVKRWQWLRYRRVLDHMTTMDQFSSLMDKMQDTVFKNYEQWDLIEPRRQELDSVLRVLRADVRGKSFLDIGPAFGSTLDVVRERGATHVEFAEYNPFFYTYNRLKGFRGYQLDARKELHRITSRKYQFIWIKQTFVADRLVSRRSRSFIGLPARYPKLDVLLEQIANLATADGLIVFCPHWTSRNGVRTISNVRDTSLYAVFQHHGYQMLPTVVGHNIEPVSPVTFVKDMSGIQRIFT